VIRQLEAELAPAAQKPVQANNAPPRVAVVHPQTNAVETNRPVIGTLPAATPAGEPKTNNVRVTEPRVEPVKPTVVQTPPPLKEVPTEPKKTPETVKVPDGPEFVAPVRAPEIVISTSGPAAKGTNSVASRTPEPPQEKRSLLQKIFGGGTKPAATNTIINPTATAQARPGLPRYRYESPSRPMTGNTAEAERAFAQGVQAHQAQKLGEAVQSYRRATQLDPAFFKGYYNLGLAASEVANMPVALSAYERALAVKPDSIDARYNFALLLKQNNYLLDAANELQKVLALNPKESRAHLVLGNMYAQQLKNTAKAREHYLAVLENDPRNSQAPAIRYWLADHPQ
jgi:Flp pilus assembly protein TadD